ncbi:MAG TPA: hypothetical protein VLY63_03325, partial [Anaerolineae bacterium]|nr:hypothetical protein [Anaerolineae bacterium]
MQSCDYDTPAGPHQAFPWPSTVSALTNGRIRLGLVVLVSLGVGLAVIISTHYVDNIKLLIGLFGGLAFVLLTMRWPEFGILCLVGFLSGLIRLSWLPLLRLGPVSLHIS